MCFGELHLELSSLVHLISFVFSTIGELGFSFIGQLSFFDGLGMILIEEKVGI